MSSRQERYEKTLQVILDRNVSKPEALLHMYWWVRFEYAIVKRDRAAHRAQKYAQKLNINLEIFEFRKIMSD